MRRDKKADMVEEREREREEEEVKGKEEEDTDSERFQMKITTWKLISRNYN